MRNFFDFFSRTYFTYKKFVPTKVIVFILFFLRMPNNCSTPVMITACFHAVIIIIIITIRRARLTRLISVFARIIPRIVDVRHDDLSGSYRILNAHITRCVRKRDLCAIRVGEKIVFFSSLSYKNFNRTVRNINVFKTNKSEIIRSRNTRPYAHARARCRNIYRLAVS